MLTGPSIYIFSNKSMYDLTRVLYPTYFFLNLIPFDSYQYVGKDFPDVMS